MHVMDGQSQDHGEIGRRIREARQRKGWTQFEFAVQAEVSPSTVQRWERGQLPRIRELMRAAEVLGVPASEFVEPPDDRSTLELVTDAVDKVASAVESVEARAANIERNQAAILRQLADLQHSLSALQGS